MGFETQEEAERWAEGMELRADALREERMLDPKEAAWQKLTALPDYKNMPESSRLLQRAVFDYAWEAGWKDAKRQYENG